MPTQSSADHLSPQSSTWVRGFSLTPVEPRIRAQIVSGSVEIPLRARDGSVRAYVLIDAADADFVNRWRWCLNSNGYAFRGDRSSGKQRMVKLHREILGLTSGDGLIADHINRNRLDNRRGNLRIATPATNQHNVSHRRSSSLYRGVTWDSCVKKWRAQVHLNGKTYFLGFFVDEVNAAHAAKEGRLLILPGAVD